MSASTTGKPRHRAERRRGPVVTILIAVGVFAVAVALALLGTGTSYALWNGTSEVDASRVTSGSTDVTINEVRDYSIPGLDLTTIGPGQSVMTPEPITVANTGTTPLSVTVSSTTVVSQTNALADDLTVTIVFASTCSADLTGGVTRRMAEFTTADSPIVLQPATASQLCLKVTMDTDAPASVQGGTVAFTLNIDALQVR